MDERPVREPAPGSCLPEQRNAAIIRFAQSGRGAVRLARLHGVQEVGGSNPLAPTAVRRTVLPAGRFYFRYKKFFVCRLAPACRRATRHERWAKRSVVKGHFI